MFAFSMIDDRCSMFWEYGMPTIDMHSRLYRDFYMETIKFELQQSYSMVAWASIILSMQSILKVFEILFQHSSI